MKTNAKTKYHFTLIALLIFSVIAVSSSTTVIAVAENRYHHDVIAYRHTDVFVTDEYVHGMFADATGLLQTNAHACPDEVGCPVELRQAGYLGIFGFPGDGHDIIHGDEELNLVFEEQGNFKVVSQLWDCCGQAGPIIMGCGARGTHNTIVSIEAEPEHWAHEFGHNQGLDHWQGCDDCNGNIMCESPTNGGSITASQCAEYEAGGKLACAGGTWGAIKACFRSGSILATATYWPGPYLYEGVKGWMRGANIRCADFDPTAWSYQVFRSDGDTLNYQPVAEIWKSPNQPEDWAVTFFDSTALPGHAYHYRIASMDSVMRQYVEPAVGMVVGVGQAPLYSAPVSISVCGNYAYVVEGWRSSRALYGNRYKFPDGGWLEVIDVSFPEAPHVVTRIPLAQLGLWADEDGGPYHVVASGKRLYMATGSPGLAIFDIANPASPVLKSVFATPGVHVAVCFPYAYYSTPQNGLLILDVSNASAPVQLGRYDCYGPGLGRSPEWSFVHGSYAYVRCQGCCFEYEYPPGYNEGGQYGWLEVASVSNPSAPQFVSSIGNAWKVQDAKRNLLYASSEHYPEERAVIDASDPSSLQISKIATWRDLLFSGSGYLSSSLFERGGLLFSSGIGAYLCTWAEDTVTCNQPWGGVGVYDVAVQDSLPFVAAFTDTAYPPPSELDPHPIYRVNSMVEDGDYIYALYRSSLYPYDPGGAWLRIYRDVVPLEVAKDKVVFLTEPPTGKVVVNGDTLSTGSSGATVLKTHCEELKVNLPGAQIMNGQRYCFSSWSDGGTREHYASCLADTYLVANLTTGNPPTYIADSSFVAGYLDVCESPYVVQGTVSVAPGRQLTIEEGARLNFASGASLVVRGTLNARGATFTSNSANPQAGDWRGLVIADGGTGNLTQCSVQYAQKGIEVVGDAGCVSNLTPSSGVLNTCTFSQCSEAGVYGGALASIDADNCTFLYNNVGVKYRGTAGHLTLNGCTLRYHELAALDIYAMCASSFAPVLENNVIEDRADRHEVGWQGVGVRLEGNINGGFTGNTVQGFYDGIVLVTDGGFPGYFLAPHPSPFSGNTISGNSHYNLKASSAPAYQNICGSYTLAAENNNWGASTSSQIEQTVFHCVDNHGLYFVDFNPWQNPPGGCPYVYSWDGERYVQENTVLGASGFSGGRTAVSDYLKLSGMKVDEGKVKLEVREFEQERSSLDAFSLLTIDYPSSSLMFLSPEGEPRLYAGVVLPTSARNAAGEDKLNRLVYADGSLYHGETGDLLTVGLGSQDGLPPHGVSSAGVETMGEGEDLLMLAGGKPVPCEDDCSPPVGGVQVLEGAKPLQGSPMSGASAGSGEKSPGRGGILIQVPVEVFGQVTWRSVARIVPREKLSEIVVPGELLGTPRPSKLRLLWDGKHSIDYLAYAKRSAATAGRDAKVNEWPLALAQHSVRGDVTRSLSRNDFAVAELGGNERISLSFAVDDRVPAGMSRCYILKSEGSYRSVRPTSAPTGTPETYFFTVASANPFNPSIQIDYGLPGATKVVVRIYTGEGRVVNTLVNVTQPAGNYTLTWDGMDSNGKRVSSGVYFFRLETPEYSETKKIVLLK